MRRLPMMIAFMPFSSISLCTSALKSEENSCTFIEYLWEGEGRDGVRAWGSSPQFSNHKSKSKHSPSISSNIPILKIQKPLNQWHLHILDLLPKLLNFLKLIVFDEVDEMDALEAVLQLLAALSLILSVLLRPRCLPLRISLRANGS